MLISVYLHRPIVEVLRCYGDLSEVINKVLEHGSKGDIEIMDKPHCPSREGAGRYDVNITNEYYLDLFNMYTPFSPKISLRRLIYWFVENEVYNELGWKQVKSYENSELKMLISKLNNALNELEKSKRYANGNTLININDVCNKIKNIKETL